MGTLDELARKSARDKDSSVEREGDDVKENAGPSAIERTHPEDKQADDIEANVSDTKRKRLEREAELDKEVREKEKPTRLNVTIDRGVLAGIELPDYIRDADSYKGGGFSESVEEQRDEKVGQIESLIDTMSRLPERLEFEKGVTLIVGENGSGKSTLAKALKFVCEYADWYEMLREKGKDEKEARESARERTIGGRGGSKGEELAASGLAPTIAQAMFEDASILSAGTPRYVDVGEIYGRIMLWRKESSQDQHHALATTSPDGVPITRIDVTKGSVSGGAGSARQSVDIELEQFRKSNLEENRMMSGRRQAVGDGREVADGVVEFLDEPENGLSPRRHLNIEEEIESTIGSELIENSIIIVPTNSVVLFESDVPRIDLDYPERGIHRPSEYADHNNIEDKAE